MRGLCSMYIIKCYIGLHFFSLQNETLKKFNKIGSNCGFGVHNNMVSAFVAYASLMTPVVGVGSSLGPVDPLFEHPSMKTVLALLPGGFGPFGCFRSDQS